MVALDRIVWRDLRSLGGQVATLSLVLAAGIAGFVALRGTYGALLGSREAWYREARFPDVWVSLERAPEAAARELALLEGVEVAWPRLSATGRVPSEGRPASAVLLSLPDRGPPPLADLVVTRGRHPARADEALVLRSYARAHGLVPGDPLELVVSGRRVRLVISGLALSPEYAAPASGAEVVPDERRFVAVWLRHAALAALLDARGAATEVLLALAPGADPEAVADAAERRLARYGARAWPRDRQVSHVFLEGEIQQLAGLATVIPAVFLGVAAFLLNLVLGRLVQVHRSRIATLRAFGYGALAVAGLYVRLALITAMAGSALGLALGLWIGTAFTGVYATFFGLPEFAFRASPGLVGTAVAIASAAALTGAVGAAARVMRLPPAEAMRPEPPPPLNPLARLPLPRVLPPGLRLVLREVLRRPVRTALSALGVALAMGTLVVSRFGDDNVAVFLQLQTGFARRADVDVALERPMPARVLSSFRALPGVRAADGWLTLPARFSAGHRRRDAVLIGHPDSAMRRVVALPGRPVAVPAEGVMLTTWLAKVLDLDVGDEVTVEIQDGARTTRRVTVTALADEPFGLQGHMRRASAERLLGLAPTITEVGLAVDPAADGLERRLVDMPGVASFAPRQEVLSQMREETEEITAVFSLVSVLFAGAIAVGVVYNDARVALSQRLRDLATLGVLGFTKLEQTALLVGELAARVALAVPAGLLVGRLWIALVARSADPERYRFPVFVSSRTDAFAALVVLVSAAAVALVVARRVARIDAAAALGTPE